MRDESSASTADAVVIPSQHKVTAQILSHWQPFIDLKLSYAGSRRAEQLSLRLQQRIVATVEDSVLWTEMAGLESQEGDAPPRIPFYKPMSWLGQIRPHRRDEAWPATGRHSSPCLSAPRSLRLRRSRLRLADARSFK